MLGELFSMQCYMIKFIIDLMQVGGLYYKSCDFLLLSKPSAGFTIVLRCAQAQGPVRAKFLFTMDFCLCGAILNFKAFCFGAYILYISFMSLVIVVFFVFILFYCWFLFFWFLIYICFALFYFAFFCLCFVVYFFIAFIFLLVFYIIIFLFFCSFFPILFSLVFLLFFFHFYDSTTRSR